jgi:hypothetical protein
MFIGMVSNVSDTSGIAVPVATISAHQSERDRLVSKTDIAERWSCHVKTVNRRLKAAGVPLFRFGETSVRVRLSDVLKIEQEATVA